MTGPTAVLADDEPLLVAALRSALEQAWPELSVVATAHNGIEAIDAIRAHQPDIAFLDIQMPGSTGIEVAHAVTEDWPEHAESTLPLWVFVTAFDDYAVEAFNTAAADYVLKPVKPERLNQTVARLTSRLNERTAHGNEHFTAQLRQLIDSEMRRQPPPATGEALRTINASVGDTVRVIPVDEVILLESADKYVTVITSHGEAVIREPLKKLLPQLDPAHFAQIHRSAIVNLTKVDAAVRDATGGVRLQLRGCDRQPAVSRVYRHLFQAM